MVGFVTQGGSTVGLAVLPLFLPIFGRGQRTTSVSLLLLLPALLFDEPLGALASGVLGAERGLYGNDRGTIFSVSCSSQDAATGSATVGALDCSGGPMAAMSSWMMREKNLVHCRIAFTSLAVAESQPSPKAGICLASSDSVLKSNSLTSAGLFSLIAGYSSLMIFHISWCCVVKTWRAVLGDRRDQSLNTFRLPSRPGWRRRVRSRSALRAGARCWPRWPHRQGWIAAFGFEAIGGEPGSWKMMPFRRLPFSAAAGWGEE